MSSIQIDDVLEGVRQVLEERWGDRFEIEWLQDYAAAEFSRGMINERGDYTVMRLRLPYAEIVNDPERVERDLVRILDADINHPKWVEAPAPVEGSSSERWTARVRKLFASLEEAGYLPAQTAFAVDPVIDTVCEVIRSNPREQL